MEFLLIEHLIEQGVLHFCTAPGSRSSPLVIAIKNHPKANLHIHYDERGLAFYALGMSQATSSPTAIIVTSGTAVGNLLPAIMEAHHSHIPLIFLTADRPPMLRDCSAHQTTDQVKIFTPFVRWQADLPLTVDAAYVRSIANQAYFHACKSTPGPVHINCPFDEPLYRPLISPPSVPILRLRLPRLHAKPLEVTHSKGLIIVGKLPQAEDIHPILHLAKRLRWPICADILSNARCFPTDEEVRYFDWLDKPTPDFVLHFGERMTSKKLLGWLKTIQTQLVHVSPYCALQDPEHILTERIQSDIPEFCATFDAPSDPQWLELWKSPQVLFPTSSSMTEVNAMRHLNEIDLGHVGIFLGNGMPIRDADHFLFPQKCRRFFANRGLCGIDGNIATIAGLAEEMPILGIIGDQTALYDLNSLPLLNKTKYPTVLLIFNNFGGGIFHHLPIAQNPHFESLWAAHHDYHFAPAAHMYHLPYYAFADIEEALKSGQSALVELTTDRYVNHRQQQAISACHL